MNELVDVAEILASSCGLVGAWLIATQSYYLRWAFFFFLCSNTCWILFAAFNHRNWMLIQMLGFVLSDLVAIWNYWLLPSFPKFSLQDFFSHRK